MGLKNETLTMNKLLFYVLGVLVTILITITTAWAGYVVSKIDSNKTLISTQVDHVREIHDKDVDDLRVTDIELIKRLVADSVDKKYIITKLDNIQTELVLINQKLK